MRKLADQLYIKKSYFFTKVFSNNVANLRLADRDVMKVVPLLKKTTWRRIKVEMTWVEKVGLMWFRKYFLFEQPYTEHAGLAFPIDSCIALRPRKSEMLVPNSTDAYGGKAFFLPSRLKGNIHQKMIILMDF